MSSAFTHPKDELPPFKKKIATLLKILGAICGGLFLGCASGGSVYLAAQATGLVVVGSSIITTSFFLGLSAILALAWGLIYQKAIGEALIPQLLFSKEQKAIAKFNKQYDKDLSLVKWTLNPGNEHARASTPNTDPLSFKEFLIVHQLKYLIAKQLLKDSTQFTFTNGLLEWDRNLREFFLRKSFQPRTQWKNKPLSLEDFLRNGTHDKSRAIALAVFNHLQKIKSAAVINALDSEWKNLDRPDQVEQLQTNIENWMKRTPHTNDASPFSNQSMSFIQLRYNNKIKGHHWLFRALFTIVDVIAVINATLVNSVGMGAGGLAIVSAILTLSGVSLSLPMAFMTMSIFATGGFAGAFFLTRNTMKTSIHSFANWRRTRSSDGYSTQCQQITDHVKTHPENNNFVLRWPFLLRAALAFFCAVGFAGFNLVTGMTMMAIWLNPQSVLDPNLVRDLVSNTQPWYVLGAGLASAFVTFIVVLSFMLKFSTNYNNESTSKKSHWSIGAFIGISAILNTFVCLANYFSGNLWTNLWLNFLGVSNPLVVTGFGVLMGISALIIGIPVFEELRDRVNDLGAVFKSSSPTESSALKEHSNVQGRPLDSPENRHCLKYPTTISIK